MVSLRERDGLCSLEMMALVTTELGVALKQVDEPVEGCVVEVAFAGVCRSDIAAADGRIPVARGRVLGHEVAGWVDGAPVAVVPFSPCNACPSCAVRARCDRPVWLGIDVDGGFAERVSVPEASLVPLPVDMPLLRAAYVEPVAAALGALIAIERGARVLVAGAGRIAELTARVIAAHGARVERYLPGKPIPVGRFDVAVEHAGNGSELVSALRSGGTLVLKSRASQTIALDAGELVARDLVVRGASHGSFTTAVDWLAAKKVVVDDLLAPPRPLEAFSELFEAARNETHKHVFAIGARI
jgi:threonine dehydrogenase-like Zn-dependent dehydrogenase